MGYAPRTEVAASRPFAPEEVLGTLTAPGTRNGERGDPSAPRMGAKVAAQHRGWGAGGAARTRGSELLVLRSLRVCPQLHPGAERFGGAGETRATSLRCAEPAWHAERP